MFDEREADKAIIATLLRSNRILWQQLEEKRKLAIVFEGQIKRSQESIMAKLVRDENGVLMLAHKFEDQAVTGGRLLPSPRRYEGEP